MTQGSRIESCWLAIFNVTFSSVSQQNFFMDPASAAPRTFACSVGIADIRPAKVRLGLRPSLRMTDGRSVFAKSFVCSDRGRRSLQVGANRVRFSTANVFSRSRNFTKIWNLFVCTFPKPSSERKGDHAVVEGACATIKSTHF